MCLVFLMRDILIPTEVLNKILQSDSLLPHELNSKVADTTNNNNNKRPLTPKSMPPAGDEHAKLNAKSKGKLQNKIKQSMQYPKICIIHGYFSDYAWTLITITQII